MKFRVTIEHYALDQDSNERDWKTIDRQEVTIPIAEVIARKIEQIIAAEGLQVNSNQIRQVLFDEFGDE